MQLRAVDCKMNSTHGGITDCGQTDINNRKITKCKERLKNGADWEKSIKGTTVHIGL